MKTISENLSYGGIQGVYSAQSDACSCEMTFAVYVPQQAKTAPCPVIWFLSGLTCNHSNVMEKGEYRKAASELGLIIVCPDTSPRGDEVPDEVDNWQMGKGAGFYLDATEKPALDAAPEDLTLWLAEQFEADGVYSLNADETRSGFAIITGPEEIS